MYVTAAPEPLIDPPVACQVYASGSLFASVAATETDAVAVSRMAAGFAIGPAVICGGVLGAATGLTVTLTDPVVEPPRPSLTCTSTRKTVVAVTSGGV